MDKAIKNLKAQACVALAGFRTVHISFFEKKVLENYVESCKNLTGYNGIVSNANPVRVLAFDAIISTGSFYFVSSKTLDRKGLYYSV